MGELRESSCNSSLLKLLFAENLKMRRTWILWLHIVMPLLGILVFLWYYSFSIWSDWGKISGYVEVVAVICPSLVGFVCAMSVEQEKQAGHFQNFLGIGTYKRKNLAVKLCSLMLWNLAAVVLTIGGFAFGFYIFVSKLQLPMGFYFKLILMIWGSQLFCYCFHLFLGLRFSKGITIGVGIVESLISALMMTGMGEGIWQWMPCSWAGRLTAYYVKGVAEGNCELLKGQAEKGSIVAVAITLLGVLLLFLWFGRFEGNRIED